jgi:hypothetical protein
MGILCEAYTSYEIHNEGVLPMQKAYADCKHNKDLRKSFEQHRQKVEEAWAQIPNFQRPHTGNFLPPGEYYINPPASWVDYIARVNKNPLPKVQTFEDYVEHCVAVRITITGASVLKARSDCLHDEGLLRQYEREHPYGK